MRRLNIRSFANKPKASQQTTSVNASVSGQKCFGYDQEAAQILRLQCAIGNKAVQRLLRRQSGSVEAGAGVVAPAYAGFDLSRVPVRNHPPVGIQAKLHVNVPGDACEQEADRVADQVVGLPEPRGETLPGRLQTKLVQTNDSNVAVAPGEIGRTLNTCGQPLAPSAREFMEPRFGRDFSHVRVHADSSAAASAQSVNARAFTSGNHLVFGEGQYAPETQTGRSLIAHELTHTLQQNVPGRCPGPEIVQRYTEAERREMAEGRVRGQANDEAVASQRHFQPGDIVFRLGSAALGFLTGEPVTHGGIYIGGGLIHDVVGFGNRNVRVSNFFSTALGEAADASVYRVVRFRGPHRDLIVPRLLSNIARRDFRMPTDPVPFNLFSSTDDYRTATCLEYAHAQFLYAIRQLSADQTVPPSVRESVRRTYFTGNAAEPNPLVRPQEQRLVGNTVDPTAGASGGGYQQPPPRTPSALVQAGLLVTAASAMASDVDPGRFSNRSEAQYTEHWPGGGGVGGTILNAVLGPTYDEVVLRTFTYRSFVDSRQFFEDVTSPPSSP